MSHRSPEDSNRSPEDSNRSPEDSNRSPEDQASGPAVPVPSPRTPTRPTAARSRSIAVPLGFFEWLLVGYLVASGLVHLYLGLEPLLDGDRLGRFHAFRVATGSFSLLLTGQLIHRIPVARYSIALIFIMQIGLFVKRYAVESPFLWTELAPLERAQRVTEFGFWMVALIFVLARPWRVARYADLGGNDADRLLR